MTEPERASAIRRRRTRYIPLPGIMETAVYLAKKKRGPPRDAPDLMDLMVWQFGRGLGIPFPSLDAAGYKSCVAGNRMRVARILYMSFPLRLFLRCISLVFVGRLHIASGYPSFVLGLRGSAEFLMKFVILLRSSHAREFQSARHVRGDPGCLVSGQFGAHDSIVKNSGDGVSHAVPSTKCGGDLAEYSMTDVTEREYSFLAAAERE